MDSYKGNNFDLSIAVKCSKPGVILDTVGINAAPTGAWSLNIDAERKVSFNIFEPKVNSSLRDSSGWHHMKCNRVIAEGTESTIRIEVKTDGIKLTVSDSKGSTYVTLSLKTPLSGKPVYIGDFPGDDSWGSKYNIHPAMIGTVRLVSGATVPSAPVETVPIFAPPSIPVSGLPVLKPVAVESDSPDTINAGIKKIEQAFRSGNINYIMLVTAPPFQAKYKPVFEKNKNNLTKIADMLATAKFVTAYGVLAEYEVTFGSRKMIMIFEKINDKWCLSSF